MRTPGAIVRDSRARKRVSQAALARRAGTTQSAISRIENDRVSPSFGTVAELLELLGEELAVSTEPIDYGHDRAMLRANLSLTPSERIARGVEFANFAQRWRGVARGRRA